jgi:NADH dehydrogenase
MNIPKKISYCYYRGGFAESLSKQLQQMQVVLLDQHNYHNFQPLLYQVATGGLEAGSLRIPFGK